MEEVPVSASDTYTVSATVSLPENAAEIRILSYDSEGGLIGNLDSVSTDPATGINDLNSQEFCKIYPTVVKSGVAFSIQTGICVEGAILVEIRSLADGREEGKFVFRGCSKVLSVETGSLMAGIYLITVHHSGRIWNEKLIVL